MHDKTKISDKESTFFSTEADESAFVLNHSDTFGIFNKRGNIISNPNSKNGIYHNDTRFVSRYEIKINDKRPLLLGASMDEDMEILGIDMTNQDITAGDDIIKEGSLYLYSKKFVYKDTFYEKVALRSYSSRKHKFEIDFCYDSDFMDIFEVKKFIRLNRKREITFTKIKGGIKYSYTGIDSKERTAEYLFSGNPEDISRNHCRYTLNPEPGEEIVLSFSIVMRAGKRDDKREDNSAALKLLNKERNKKQHYVAEIKSSSTQFNHWVNRSTTDLISLCTDTKSGMYPYAGIPWFASPFGRDAIITALETLWAFPKLSKDVLFYLAANQAKEINKFNEAEPGKIFHEKRHGEIVSAGDLPFGMYYGSIDVTPLFIILALKYYKRTADIETISGIWENLKLALNWIDEYGDEDDDGFVEYKYKNEKGLYNQGWKDSPDAIFHSNGKIAESPIALCEVQSYVYEAKLSGAFLAGKFEEKELSRSLLLSAAELKKNFNKKFWDSKLNNFVIALDADKKPCRINSSNGGHCLLSGIADDKHIKALVENLTSDKFFSGWGIRTISEDSVCFNPLSYHNGSIWPHDTTLITYGISKYGYKSKVSELFTGMYEAARHSDFYRLPELFCGFRRRDNEGPVTYPVACSPQAWSSAAVYMLLQSALGIEINAVKKRIIFNNPVLPSWIQEAVISNIDLGDDTAEIRFETFQNHVGINVLSRKKGWEVISVK